MLQKQLDVGYPVTQTLYIWRQVLLEKWQKVGHRGAELNWNKVHNFL